jgi:hypothetical protein
MQRNYDEDESRSMTGEGWRDLLNKGLAAASNIFPDADENARPIYPGELHAIGRCGNKPCRSNFTGPGTQISKRLRRKPRGKTLSWMAGDPPRNPTDVVSRRHDLEYGLSTTPAQIRAADLRMLKSLKTIRKNKTDSRINTGPANAGIKAKIAAEDFGLLSKGAFIDDEKPSEADRNLYQTELDKMTQHGLGEKSERPGEKLLKHLGRHVLKTKKSRRRGK